MVGSTRASFPLRSLGRMSPRDFSLGERHLFAEKKLLMLLQDAPSMWSQRMATLSCCEVQLLHALWSECLQGEISKIQGKKQMVQIRAVLNRCRYVR